VRDTTASFTPGCSRNTASISPSSMRIPRSLTCWSIRRGTRCFRPRGTSPGLRSYTGNPRSPAGERVRDELLGGQLRAIEVAPRQPVARQMQFPGTPTGTGFKCGSSTNTRVLAIGRPIGGGDSASATGSRERTWPPRCIRWSIVIDETERQRPARHAVQPVTTGQQCAQSQSLRPVLVQRLLGHWCRQEAERDLSLREPAHQLRREAWVSSSGMCTLAPEAR